MSESVEAYYKEILNKAEAIVTLVAPLDGTADEQKEAGCKALAILAAAYRRACICAGLKKEDALKGAEIALGEGYEKALYIAHPELKAKEGMQ